MNTNEVTWKLSNIKVYKNISLSLEEKKSTSEKKQKNLCKIYNIGTLVDWTLKKSPILRVMEDTFHFDLRIHLSTSSWGPVYFLTWQLLLASIIDSLATSQAGATKTCPWLVQPCEAISWCREHQKLLLLVQKLYSLLHESSIYSISLLYYRQYCTSAWKVCRLAFVLVFSSLDTFYICIASSRLWRTLFWSVDNRLLSGISKSYISLPFHECMVTKRSHGAGIHGNLTLEKLQYSTFVLGRKTFF